MYGIVTIMCGTRYFHLWKVITLNYIRALDLYCYCFLYLFGTNIDIPMQNGFIVIGMINDIK